MLFSAQWIEFSKITGVKEYASATSAKTAHTGVRHSDGCLFKVLPGTKAILRERLLYKERIKKGEIGLKGCGGLFRPSFSQNLPPAIPKTLNLIVLNYIQW